MFKIIALILISLYFCFQLFLQILRYRNRNAGIPEELNDIYDEERYLKWKQYSAEKIKIELFSSITSTLVMVLLIVFDVFALVSKNIDNIYTSALIVLAVFIGVDTLVSLPFTYINTIKIEDKYGFNKSTTKTFVVDQIKSFVITAIITIGLTMLFIVLYEAMHEYILILFSAIVFVIVLFISFLYPIISKMNNKFVSLEEGELRTSLINMLESHGYKVSDIKVMDASRRTTKSNAYFTGFGKLKTIVLYDNLLNIMSNEQILAIFAHEMGHGLHKDSLKGSVFSLLNIIIFVLFAWLLVYYPDIYKDFGFNGLNYGFAVVLLINVVLPFVSVILNLISSALSRKHEYKADEQAFKEGYSEELISALKVLSRENLSDLNPHPLIVLLYYSHPTLLQRINHIRELEKKNN